MAETDIDTFVQRITRKINDASKPFATTLAEALLSFCEENAFDTIKTTTVAAIAQELIEVDAAPDSSRSATSSAAHLQKLLLANAVERPPRSHGTFLPSEAVALHDFFCAYYYRHWKLFQYCLTGEKELVLRQSVAGGAEEPTPLPPLTEAHLVSADGSLASNT